MYDRAHEQTFMEKRWGVIFEVIMAVTELKGMDEEMILGFCCSDDKKQRDIPKMLRKSQE